MPDAARDYEELMSLPRSIATVIITLFLYSASTQAAKTASCTFNTFSAPSGYSLSLVNGVSDDGTVMGQLVDNKTREFVAFTYSASGQFAEYTAPQSSSTWLYGGTVSGVNAGSYQDSAYPQPMHGFLLKGQQFASVDYPKASNTWLFDMNNVGAAVGSYNSGSVTKGFQLVNGQYTTIAHSGSQ